MGGYSHPGSECASSTMPIFFNVVCLSFLIRRIVLVLGPDHPGSPDRFRKVCSQVVPRSRFLEGFGGLMSLDFVCSRLGSGCYPSGKQGTLSPVCLFGCLLLGIVCGVSSMSLIRHDQCSLSFGCFLSLHPRSSIVSTSALSGFHGRQLGSPGLLSVLLGRDVRVTLGGKIVRGGYVVISTARAGTECGRGSTCRQLLRRTGGLQGIVCRFSSPDQGRRLPAGMRGNLLRSTLSCYRGLISCIGRSRALQSVPTMGRQFRLLDRVVDSSQRRLRFSGSPSTQVKRGATSSSFFNCGARVTVASRQVVTTTIIADKRGNSNLCLRRLMRGSHGAKLRIGDIVKSATCSKGEGLRLTRSGRTPRRSFRLVTGLGPVVSGASETRKIGKFDCGGSTRVFMYPTNRLTARGCLHRGCDQRRGPIVACCFSMRGYGRYPGTRKYCGRNTGSESCKMQVGSSLRLGRGSFRRATRFGRLTTAQCGVRTGGDRVGGQRKCSQTSCTNLFNVRVRKTAALFMAGVGEVVALVRRR